MQKDRGFRVLAIAAICISVLGLAIGYSALSTTLSINTTATVKGSTWSIKFDNLATPVLTGNAQVETPATITATDIALDVSLTLPGDSVVYTFDVSNDGTIDAKLSDAPTLTGLSEAAAQNITYTLTYSDGSTISANDTLDAGTTRHLKLTATFNQSATTVPSTDTVLNLNATLLYVQK